MTNQQNLFKSLENAPLDTHIGLGKLLEHIPWNYDGLIPAIAQDQESKTVLMLAWVNQEALTMTLKSGKAHYWSRSRQKIWCKGESSGHSQKISTIALDCDGDALLYSVLQTGPACHTNRPHCFFWSLDSTGATLIQNR